MVNFGRLTAEICSGVWGAPSKFQRVSRLGNVTARHSSSGRRPNFAALNRGRHLYSTGRPPRWALAHIVVSFASFFSKHFLLASFILHSRYSPTRLAGFSRQHRSQLLCSFPVPWTSRYEIWRSKCISNTKSQTFGKSDARYHQQFDNDTVDESSRVWWDETANNVRQSVSTRKHLTQTTRLTYCTAASLFRHNSPKSWTNVEIFRRPWPRLGRLRVTV